MMRGISGLSVPSHGDWLQSPLSNTSLDDPNLIIATVLTLTGWMDSCKQTDLNARIYIYYGLPGIGMRLPGATVVRPDQIVGLLDRWCNSGEK